MDRKIAEAFLHKHKGDAVEAILDAAASAGFGAREDALLLQALEVAGVENWDGWENAQEIFHELLLEDEDEEGCDE